MKCPEHAGDAIQSPASAGAEIEGACFPGKPYYRLRLYRPVTWHLTEHAPPLGRAHTEAAFCWPRLAAIDPSDHQGARGRGS
jgi:hypothetical protein